MIKKKSMKLGGGGRFAALEDKLETRGMPNKKASAMAAVIGRKKYGADKMSSMAAAAKRRMSK